MPFYIIRKNIVRMENDAVVNASNCGLVMSGGVCRAIFHAAGEQPMKEACEALAPIETGAAVVTPGFRLCAGAVIHTAVPMYRDGKSGEAELLADCYRACLTLAAEKRFRSVAFPLLGAGVCGFPEKTALRVSRETIQNFLRAHRMDVYLCLNPGIPEYNGKRDEELEIFRFDGFWSKRGEPPAGSLAEALSRMDAPFSEILLKTIDKKGLRDPEVYNAAYIDRRHFAKLKSPAYTPKKATVLALALGLRLSPEEADGFLRAAGYALSRSDERDLIVEYFLRKKLYDVAIVNAYLADFHLPLLGYSVRE